MFYPEALWYLPPQRDNKSLSMRWYQRWIRLRFLWKYKIQESAFEILLGDTLYPELILKSFSPKTQIGFVWIHSPTSSQIQRPEHRAIRSSIDRPILASQGLNFQMERFESLFGKRWSNYSRFTNSAFKCLRSFPRDGKNRNLKLPNKSGRGSPKLWWPTWKKHRQISNVTWYYR